MKVRRLSGNLKPHTPVRKLPRLKMPAFIEGSLHSNMFFNLELKPAGNPWFKGTNGKQHHRWAMRLWARLVSEKPTQATCSECPLGSWCKASRQSTNGRRLAHGGVHAVTYSTVKTATQLMVVVAFPPSKSKGSAWTPEFRGVPTDHYWRWTYQDLYYRPDTYGLCVQAFGYEDHMVDNNGKEGHNLQNGQRHTLAWLVQRACSTTVPSQYRPTLTRVYPFCWPIQIRLTTLAPQVCNPVAEAPFAATTKTHCEAVTCGKVSKTTYMPHGTTWGCKQFLTGPQVQVTPTCPLNLLDHYQVEHMFDDAQTSPLTGHGFGTNIVNSYANFVMAWGQWNNLVSGINRGTWADIKKEKLLVYGDGLKGQTNKKVMDVVNNVLQICRKYGQGNHGIEPAFNSVDADNHGYAALATIPLELKAVRDACQAFGCHKACNKFV